jgi:hypothetical protein
VLLGLCATRIHYTTHLPLGDPLNQGHPFFGAHPAYTRRLPLTHLPADSVVAELLVVSVVTILWIPYMYAPLSLLRSSR